jgi:hypothetical protein
MLVATLDKKTAAMQLIRDVTHCENGDQNANVIGRGYWQHTVPGQAHATYARDELSQARANVKVTPNQPAM